MANFTIKTGRRTKTEGGVFDALRDEIELRYLARGYKYDGHANQALYNGAVEGAYVGGVVLRKGDSLVVITWDSLN